MGTHDRHRVGLPGRNVHLADTEPRQEQCDSKFEIRHKRKQDKQDVRWEMGKDHRLDQTDALRQGRREQNGDTREQVRAEEDARRAKISFGDLAPDHV